MSKQVNLYDARWLKREHSAPPWPLLATLGTGVLLALAAALFNHWQTQGLEHRLAQAQAEQQRLKALSTPVADQNTALVALAAAAQQREAMLVQWRGIDSRGQDSHTAGTPASTWLTALSRVVEPGVWLTEVQIDLAGSLRMQGKTQDGTRLSAYLERWREEPLLASIALQTLDAQRQPGTSLNGPTELVFKLTNKVAGTTAATDTATPPRNAVAATGAAAQNATTARPAP